METAIKTKFVDRFFQTVLLQLVSVLLNRFMSIENF